MSGAAGQRSGRAPAAATVTALLPARVSSHSAVSYKRQQTELNRLIMISIAQGKTGMGGR